ncbi:GatB/YqeY domain-containing protein [Haloplasma contractile]|uniref:Glutamyl-tRNA amidotransferase subunit E protein n=1 Tax=Haloplasma contractile SSD-17B TaxID=1033810 RepID=U2EB43_9MOLU|nr:GatB/YqeY domain-containing protein [Haloplasma contractile]ERJ12323.1 glutamyl-tRNA amidotransferase subunit E protein [Haloplasma contractile SSD-17B]
MLMDQIKKDMKEAMKAKDKERLSVIRLLKSAVDKERIDKGLEEVKDEQIIEVIGREVKQRKDSITEFEKGGREDLVEKSKAELQVLQAYLPEQLSDDEIKQVVQETCEEIGATSMKDMGSVMSKLMPKVKGKAEGSKVNKFVKEFLNK